MNIFKHQFKDRLLTPGPTAIPDQVREAMAKAMIHHRKEVFKEVLHETQAQLQALFGTKQVVMPLAASGTGAMVAAITNLFNAGDEVICVEAGKFGERFVEIAQNYHVQTHVIKVEWSKALTMQELEKALIDYPKAKAVLMQACETSTGVMQDVQSAAKLCEQYHKLLVVDGISQIAIAPCPMDEWGIDCLLTGSQKGLLCPPGLAFISLSDKAWAAKEQVKQKDFYFDLNAERNNCLKDQSHFTTPVSLIMGLNAGLSMIFESGLENIYRKQFALREMTRAGISELGLKNFVTDDCAAWGLTSVLMPENTKSSQVLAEIKKQFALVMASGQDDYKDSLIRIGHMGYVDYADILVALDALSTVLNDKLPKNTQYLAKALKAYHFNINKVK